MIVSAFISIQFYSYRKQWSGQKTKQKKVLTFIDTLMKEYSIFIFNNNVIYSIFISTWMFLSVSLSPHHHYHNIFIYLFSLCDNDLWCLVFYSSQISKKKKQLDSMNFLFLWILFLFCFTSNVFAAVMCVMTFV